MIKVIKQLWLITPKFIRKGYLDLQFLVDFNVL